MQRTKQKKWVQETWSTFFQKVQNFQQRSHIRTFLYGILYNKIKELWRSNKKYTLSNSSEEDFTQYFDEFGEFLSIPKSPESWFESKEFIEVLEDELTKLPENQRIAFRLKEIEGEKTIHICDILGITTSNLGVLLYRAKNTLRIRIEKRMSS